MSQDTKTNRLIISNAKHNHPIINKRRIAGELKSDRVKIGLPAEYRKIKKNNIKTSVFEK